MKQHKQEWVLGFAFDVNQANIVLIKKNKPAFMKGKRNGIGGKVEFEENLTFAMEREFLEETGVLIPSGKWQNFGNLSYCDGCIHLFSVSSPEIYKARTVEEEEIGVFLFDEVFGKNTMPNLGWLATMARNHERNLDHCKFFEIKEIQ
jgi:8-oxo-dGTP diphosphatase